MQFPHLTCHWKKSQGEREPRCLRHLFKKPQGWPVYKNAILFHYFNFMGRPRIRTKSTEFSSQIQLFRKKEEHQPGLCKDHSDNTVRAGICAKQ